MVCELVNAVMFVFVVRALYRLFRGVDERQASLMLTLFLPSVPISFLNVLNEIAALALFRGADYLSVFGEPEREALGMLFIRLHGHGVNLAAIFWGLWLIPFGVLVIRSGFFPKVAGLAPAPQQPRVPRHEPDLLARAGLPSRRNPLRHLRRARRALDHAVAANQGRERAAGGGRRLVGTDRRAAVHRARRVSCVQEGSGLRCCAISPHEPADRCLASP